MKSKNLTFYVEKLQLFVEYFTSESVRVQNDGFVHYNAILREFTWIDGPLAHQRVTACRPDKTISNLTTTCLHPANHLLRTCSHSASDIAIPSLAAVFEDSQYLGSLFKVRLEQRARCTLVRIYLVLWKNCNVLDGAAVSWLQRYCGEQISQCCALAKEPKIGLLEKKFYLLLRRRLVAPQPANQCAVAFKWNRIDDNNLSEPDHHCEQWYVFSVARTLLLSKLQQTAPPADAVQTTAQILEHGCTNSAATRYLHQTCVSCYSFDLHLQNAACQLALGNFLKNLAIFLELRVNVSELTPTPPHRNLSSDNFVDQMNLAHYLSASMQRRSSVISNLAYIWLGQTQWYYCVKSGNLLHAADGHEFCAGGTDEPTRCDEMRIFSDQQKLALLAECHADDSQTFIDHLSRQGNELDWFITDFALERNQSLEARLRRTALIVHHPFLKPKSRIQIKSDILALIMAQSVRSDTGAYDLARLLRLRKLDDATSERVLRRFYGSILINAIRVHNLLQIITQSSTGINNCDAAARLRDFDANLGTSGAFAVPCALIVTSQNRVIEWLMAVQQQSRHHDTKEVLVRGNWLHVIENGAIQAGNANSQSATIKMRLYLCNSIRAYRDLRICDLILCDALIVTHELLAALNFSTCHYMHQFADALLKRTSQDPERTRPFAQNDWLPCAQAFARSMLRKPLSDWGDESLVPLEAVCWNSVFFDGEWARQDRRVFEKRKEQILPSVCKSEKQINGAMLRFCRALSFQGSVTIVTSIPSRGEEMYAIPAVAFTDKWRYLLLPYQKDPLMLPRNWLSLVPCFNYVEKDTLAADKNTLVQPYVVDKVVIGLTEAQKLLIDCALFQMLLLQDLQSLKSSGNVFEDARPWDTCNRAQLPSEMAVKLLKPSYRFVLHWLEHNVNVAPLVIHNFSEQILQRTSRFLSQIRFDTVDSEACGTDEFDAYDQDLLDAVNEFGDWNAIENFERESQVASDVFYDILKLSEKYQVESQKSKNPVTVGSAVGTGVAATTETCAAEQNNQNREVGFEIGQQFSAYLSATAQNTDSESKKTCTSNEPLTAEAAREQALQKNDVNSTHNDLHQFKNVVIITENQLLTCIENEPAPVSNCSGSGSGAFMSVESGQIIQNLSAQHSLVDVFNEEHIGQDANISDADEYASDRDSENDHATSQSDESDTSDSSASDSNVFFDLEPLHTFLENDAGLPGIQRNSTSSSSNSSSNSSSSDSTFSSNNSMMSQSNSTDSIEICLETGSFGINSDDSLEYCLEDHEMIYRLTEALRCVKGANQSLRECMQRFEAACEYGGDEILDSLTGMGWSNSLQCVYLLQRTETVREKAAERLGYNTCLTSLRDRHIITALTAAGRAKFILASDTLVNLCEEPEKFLLRLRKRSQSADEQACAKKLFGHGTRVASTTKKPPGAHCLNDYSDFYARLAPALLSDEKNLIGCKRLHIDRAANRPAQEALESRKTVANESDADVTAYAIDADGCESEWNLAVARVQSNSDSLARSYADTLESLRCERSRVSQYILRTILLLIESMRLEPSRPLAAVAPADLKALCTEINDAIQYIVEFETNWPHERRTDAQESFREQLQCVDNCVYSCAAKQYRYFRDNLAPVLQSARSLLKKPPISMSLCFAAQQICTYCRNAKWLTIDIDFILKQQTQMPERLKNVLNAKSAYISALDCEMRVADESDAADRLQNAPANEAAAECAICAANLVFVSVALFPCGHLCCWDCYSDTKKTKHPVLYENETENVILPIGAACDGERCPVCRYIFQKHEKTVQLSPAAVAIADSPETATQKNEKLQKDSEAAKSPAENISAPWLSAQPPVDRKEIEKMEPADENKTAKKHLPIARERFAFAHSAAVLSHLKKKILCHSKDRVLTLLVVSQFAPMLCEVERALSIWACQIEDVNLHTACLENSQRLIDWQSELHDLKLTTMRVKRSKRRKVCKEKHKGGSDFDEEESEEDTSNPTVPKETEKDTESIHCTKRKRNNSPDGAQETAERIAVKTVRVVFHHIDLTHSVTDDAAADNFGRIAPPLQDVDGVFMCETLSLRLKNDNLTERIVQRIQATFFESIQFAKDCATKHIVQFQVGSVDAGAIF